MADIKTKEIAHEANVHNDLKLQSTEEAGAPAAPTGWRYRPFRLGAFTVVYASPPTQLVLVALVCFLCPGMFNALNGLGGGGQLAAAAADNANVSLYSTFSVVGFFAGTFANALGIKLTLSFGGLGYCIYASALLCYNHTKNSGFLIFAGALLGIPLGENLHSTNNQVNDGTYIGFIVLMFVGAVLAWCLIDAKNIIRSDGSRVIAMKHPTWRSEFLGLWEVLRNDSFIVLLFPAFLASNWFYTYQFNDFNLARFNIRTRALNNTLYWSSQIIGAYTFGYALDSRAFRRSVRAKAALSALFCLTMAIWGGGYAYQRGYTRGETTAKDYIKSDWTDHGYVGPMFLYMFYGFYDAAWQTCIYWFMGALTNSSRKAANFAGFYKGIQSAGAAIIYRIDALDKPFMNIFASSWALLAGSLIVAAPVIIWKIKDTVPVETDLKFSDESLRDVVAVAPVRDKM
ncbi:MAG: hypothetical protein M1812_004065 [Candelaria pacifica]|nr:MAG: hypothetical protein M1812_004065 [Candelaria pacifica]